MEDNIFSTSPTDELEDWDEEDGDEVWEEDEDGEEVNHHVDPDTEVFLQYGTETVVIKTADLQERNVGSLFTAYAEDLMLTRPIEQMNIRSGDKFVNATTFPEAGTVYVATVSVDSKG